MTGYFKVDQSVIEFAARQFAASTREHEMHVVHADGLYRHLRCRQPGTGLWGWDIITWPHYLAITGDIGGFTFCREADMLTFFTGPVNPGYWLEKCIAWSPHSEPGGRVSVHRIREILRGREIDLSEYAWEDLQALDDSRSTGEAVEILMNHAHPDAWDWDITEPDLHAVRALHAISWTVQQWRQLQAGCPANGLAGTGV